MRLPLLIWVPCYQTHGIRGCSFMQPYSLLCAAVVEEKGDVAVVVVVFVDVCGLFPCPPCVVLGMDSWHVPLRHAM